MQRVFGFKFCSRAVLDGSELYLFVNAGVQPFTLHDPVSEADPALADGGVLVDFDISA